MSGRTLITGATGFIGGAAAHRLIDEGRSVVVLARNPARAAGLALRGATIVQGDVRDGESVKRACEGCDAVIHAAGVPRPASWKTFHSVHIEGTKNVAEAAIAAGVRRLVNIASQSVLFGGDDLIDVDDGQPYPARYIDPYSATKAAAEQAAMSFNARGIEVVSLRPGVVWGRGDTTILPIMARLSRSPLGIPACGDGSNIETLTHIANLSDAILAALSSPRAPGNAYIISDGTRVTWRESLSRQLDAAGIRAKFFCVPRMIAMPSAWLLDRGAGMLGLPVPLAYFGVRTAVTSRRFKELRAGPDLGCSTRVSFEDGLVDLGRWVREIGGPEGLVRGGDALRNNGHAAEPISAR